MKSFGAIDFNSAPRSVCEIGGAQRLVQLVTETFGGTSHALVVTDPGFLKTRIGRLFGCWFANGKFPGQHLVRHARRSAASNSLASSCRGTPKQYRSGDRPWRRKFD